jgi:hypothetical protein
VFANFAAKVNRASVVAIALVISACAARTTPQPSGPTAQLPTSADNLSITDLSPKFLAFYDSATSASLAPDERYAMWKRLYGFAAVPPTPFGDSLARRVLDSAWSRYPDSLRRIRKGIASVGVDPAVELRHVVELLGCGANTHVNLIAFVGGFEDNAFAFAIKGVPTVAIPIESGHPAASMVHEFTHALHRSSGCADIKSGYGQSLGELVITEGLAMRVVEALLPGQPEYTYVAHSQSWLDTANARRTAILNGIRDHVSEAGNSVAQRFTFGEGTTGLSREAYYAGWVIVGELLRGGMTFHQIAKTPAADFPGLIVRAISGT